MKLNNSIIIILTIIAGYLLIPHLSSISGLLLVILTLIGYGITKDYIISIFISTIITYVVVLLNTKKEKDNSMIEKFYNRKNGNRNKKKNKKKVNKKNIETFDDDDIPIFDSKNSFLHNFKSLTPSQIKGLNKDTKQLIKTQQTLLETLKTMGPAIKDGKSVLDTFKNYFGNDSDIGNVLN